jgi:hypothetical protein
MTTSGDQLIQERAPGGDGVGYALAVIFGSGSGWLDIRFTEIALTSMAVFFGCMLVAFIRPRRPWRWILIVCLLVPAVEWLAYRLLPFKPYPAQIAQSLIAFVPGIVGGVGGAVGRGVVDNLFRKK